MSAKFSNSGTPIKIASRSRALALNKGLRRIAKAAGFDVVPLIFYKPAKRHLAVWGRLPASKKAMARYPKAKLYTFEDAFLRSVVPGPRTPPIGMTIDDLGVHFDMSSPSRLEEILKNDPLDNPDLIEQSRDGIAFLNHYGLSKYNPTPRNPELFEGKAGFVLVLDQVYKDASITGAGADAETFNKMLQAAKAENPGKKILIRAHPAALSQARRFGHYSRQDEDERTELYTAPCNPVDLLTAASKVYCVSSQFGFEAILAGHVPVVFGAPFYAGWGLTDDRLPVERRGRKLTVEQLFMAAMITYPFWYDRTLEQETDLMSALRQLLAESRAHWDGSTQSHILGVRMWKYGFCKKFLTGAGIRARFVNSESQALRRNLNGGRLAVWASSVSEAFVDTCEMRRKPLVFLEDGLIRSVGLGADLTPPSSMVIDDLGIYYDPTRHSRLEMLINASIDLPEFAYKRARDLRARIVANNVTKYNYGAETDLPDIPKNRKIIVVPGQVEDDASILKGCTDVRTNRQLLEVARTENPDAFIIFKPHPDVQIGLRDGGDSLDELAPFYDAAVKNCDPALLIDICDELWTMSSLMGFEALLRKKRVTCFGNPFYAGWGLTDDRGPKIVRRHARPTLDGLVHAALIDYPRYMDPVSGLPCTPELVVERIIRRQSHKTPHLRMLAKLQGWLSRYAFIWR